MIDGADGVLWQIVDRLFHVCINFGQIPDICYYENSASGNNHRLEVQLRTDIQEVGPRQASPVRVTMPSIFEKKADFC